MNDIKQRATLLKLLSKYLDDSSWKDAKILFEDNRFRTFLQNECSDVVSLLTGSLNEETLTTKPELYNCCEYLLMEVAKHANPQDAIFEFLEIVETTKSDPVFISVLKALQISLLKQPEKKALSLEWVLQAICTYFRNLPFPKKLKKTFNEESISFLENSEEISRIVQMQLTICMFLEPIEKEIEKIPVADSLRNNDTTRRNVMICFLLNLLDSHLNRLYVTWDDKAATNTYIKQCRETLTCSLSNLLGQDPFYLLGFIEERIRFPLSPEIKLSEEKSTDNVFLLESKTSIESFGHYFHSMFIMDLIPEQIPKIYDPFYVFEKMIYLITSMLKSDYEHVQMKGVELGIAVVAKVLKPYYNQICDSYLELMIFEEIFASLLQLIVYSENEQIRRNGVQYLEQLILKFNDPGRKIILDNLLETYTDNSGLLGYLIIIYKKMIVEKLNSYEDELPKEYTGQCFEKIVVQLTCKLPQEEKSDLIDLSDRIISSLNFIRFLAIRDRKNLTTIWNLKDNLQNGFLSKLRMGIDLSRAHYKQRQREIESGTVIENYNDISLTIGTDAMPELTSEQQLSAIGNCVNKLDLMDSLLCRVNECLSNVP